MHSICWQHAKLEFIVAIVGLILLLCDFYSASTIAHLTFMLEVSKFPTIEINKNKTQNSAQNAERHQLMHCNNTVHTLRWVYFALAMRWMHDKSTKSVANDDDVIGLAWEAQKKRSNTNAVLTKY